VSGSENTSDTELRVMSRALELAFAPAYHASTIVRSSPNAVIATTIPVTVNAVLSLWRNAFRAMRRGTNMFDRREVRGLPEKTTRATSIFSLNYARTQDRARHRERARPKPRRADHHRDAALTAR
jgi:hypothetical protein